MEKYINTSGFDMNSFDADRIAAREAQEKSKIYQDPNVIAALEAQDKKMREHAESLRRMQAADELGFAMRQSEEKFKKEQQEKERQERMRAERQKDEELRQQRRATVEKLDAMREAYSRYRKKSVFYRMFHKSVYKMRISSMNVEDINNLYGGKSR